MVLFATVLKGEGSFSEGSEHLSAITKDSSVTWLTVYWNFCLLFVSCQQPFCSLHLHLQLSENPYTSGSISSKETAPGLLVATGKNLTHLYFTCSLSVCEMFCVSVKVFFSSVSPSAKLINSHVLWTGRRHVVSSKSIMSARYLLLCNNPSAGLSPNVHGIITNRHY